MRKSFLFCALMAVIAMMTGCQKEQDGTTLKAIIDQDTKTYIGQINSSSYPFWESGDQVIIHGVENVSMDPYSIVPSTSILTNGTINGVEFEAPYCAVFPARLVEDMGAISSSSCTAHIYLNTHQKYQEVSEGGPQKVEMPMAAFTTSGTTLYFKNLCSVIRVEVQTNTTIGQFEVRSITVDAGTAIAGHCTATITPDGVSIVEPDQAENRSVTLHKNDYSTMGLISPNYPKSFYIVVPPFSSSSVTITVETEDGRYFSQSVSNANIGRSKIAPITLDASTHTDLLIGTEAFLESGTAFNSHANLFSGYNRIDFKHLENNDEPNYTPKHQVQDPNRTDAPKIWMYKDGTSLIVASTANTIYAHASCSTMFQNLRTVEAIDLEGGVHFNTSLVTDMSHMFEGCEALGSAFNGLQHFTTSNVTTMAHMFDGCSTLGQGGLSLRTFDTHNLAPDGLVAMFNGCSLLQSLDLSSFTTEQITDMSLLFNGCSKMQNLDIRHFKIHRNATTEEIDVTRTNMCTNLYFMSVWNDITITCTQDVANFLQSGTGLSQTIINNGHLIWHIVPEQ